MFLKKFFLNILFSWARPSLWHVGSSSLTKDQISGPLHWKQRVSSHWSTRDVLGYVCWDQHIPKLMEPESPHDPSLKGMVYLKGVGLCWYLEELLITSPISPPHSHYHPMSGDWVSFGEGRIWLLKMNLGNHLPTRVTSQMMKLAPG